MRRLHVPNQNITECAPMSRSLKAKKAYADVSEFESMLQMLSMPPPLFQNQS